MACGIYTITNKANGKLYIGSAVDIDIRWNTHRKQLRNKNHHNEYLQRAWDKYGQDGFLFEIIEHVECIDDLLEREQFWLDKYESYNYKIGYNICKIAGSMIGFKFSDESKQKLSEMRKGFVHSEETKRKMSESHKGKTMNFSDEFLERLSESRKGENNPSAKLNEEDVREIKKLLSQGVYMKDIAKIFKVSVSCIGGIKQGKKWKHVKLEESE